MRIELPDHHKRHSVRNSVLSGIENFPKCQILRSPSAHVFRHTLESDKKSVARMISLDLEIHWSLFGGWMFGGWMFAVWVFLLGNILESSTWLNRSVRKTNSYHMTHMIWVVLYDLLDHNMTHVKRVIDKKRWKWLGLKIFFLSQGMHLAKS